MIERLKIIVSLAIFAASMIGSVTFYFLRVNRPKSADIYRLEWVKEEDARRKEQR